MQVFQRERPETSLLLLAEYFGESKMGEVVQFIAKRDLERARLIQEARAVYERIFPTRQDLKE